MSEDQHRTPERELYDAIIELAGESEFRTSCYAIAKFTFEVKGAQCIPTKADPLFHDFRKAEKVKLIPGTDFWPQKEYTDVVIRGFARPTKAKTATQMRVTARIGQYAKTIAVFGKRTIRFSTNNNPIIDSPEPFQEMPLTYSNAYGGIDLRMPVTGPLEADKLIVLSTGAGHPGMYPRNTLGKGYLLFPAQGAEGLEMPNLEDPSDLLTPERLVVGDPKLWYKQPLPWCFDFVPVIFFPRNIFFGLGADAWFPGPEDEQMLEVKRNYLPKNYRTMLKATEEKIHPQFYQEASYGLMMPKPKPGEQVSIEGMHPEQSSWTFTLPTQEPTFQFNLEGTWQPAQPKLHHIVIYPDLNKVHMVWGASTPLHRYFIPGIHKHIPVGVSINNDKILLYQPPPVIRELVKDPPQQPS